LEQGSLGLSYPLNSVIGVSTAALVHEPVVYADITDLDIVNVPEHRNEWLDLRRAGIGGSEAAAIVGVDPWSTRFEVYHDKLGNVPPKDQTRHMEWGHRLEDSVRRWLGDQLGVEVVHKRIIYRHPEYPFMLANMDGEIGDDAIAECKNTDLRNEEEWADGPPLHYTLQVNHYLAVSGRQRAYVAVLIGGNDPRYFIIERDEDLISMLIAAESDFWTNNVLARVEPPVTARDGELLGGLYAPEPDSEILLPPEALRLLTARKALKEATKEAEEEIRLLENQVKAMMGNHTVGIGPDGTVLVTWKSHDETKIVPARLKEDMPLLAARYSNTKPVRSFLSKV
jgi:putative phage-type endonuclease